MTLATRFPFFWEKYRPYFAVQPSTRSKSRDQGHPCPRVSGTACMHFQHRLSFCSRHTRFSRTRYLAGSFALWICLYVGMFHLFRRSVIVLLENPTFWLISVSLSPSSIMERISFNTGSLIFMSHPMFRSVRAVYSSPAPIHCKLVA